MSSKIQLLPPHEALKIAAGEVIERPAHVVKELVENSIDSGASTIDVYIRDTGKSSIRIVDNGCGMSAEDATMCFLPHATSKILNLDDLQSIKSFGFRGEALASIAAISKITLITRTDSIEKDSVGIKVIYTENSVAKQEPVACPVGTDINIKDLFYNTPVRKKFLKQDETEWNAIQQVFNAFCFSYPPIHFRLFNNEKLVLNAPGVNDIRDRAAQLWDYTTAQQLTPLISNITVTGEQQNPPFKISGAISHHTFWRHGRYHINFFVNKRWVKNPELSKSLIKGYLDVLPPGKFPAALISIEIDGQFIDVNIHPKKEEVKFIKAGTINTVLTNLVKKTLEQHHATKISSLAAPVTTTHFNKPNIPMRPIMPEQFMENFFPDKTASETHKTTELIYTKPPERVSTNFHMPLHAFEQPYELEQKYQNKKIESTQQPHKIIGYLFSTYILLEKDGEIVFVDQHAAHERILFEKYRKNFLNQQGTSLLFPETIAMEPYLIKELMEHKNFFDQQGIDIDVIGDRSIVVRTAPPQLKGPSLHDLITEAAHFIEEHHYLDPAQFNKNFNHHLHAQMACKGAVKAGDILTHQQMAQLLNDLQQVENRFICAHGRPTLWTISKSDLEKHFKRC